MDRHRVIRIGVAAVVLVSLRSHAAAQAVEALDLPFVSFAHQLLSCLRPLMLVAAVLAPVQFIMGRSVSGLMSIMFAMISYGFTEALGLVQPGAAAPAAAVQAAPAEPVLSNLLWIALAVVLVAVAVGVIVHLVRSHAEQEDPRLATAPVTEEPGLATSAARLRGNSGTLSMPDGARAGLERIRAHVAEIQALGLPEQHALVADVQKLLDSDLRDLLLRFKRVEVARRLLPGAVKLGDDELVSGLEQIEHALLAQRQSIATSALNDLKVQSVFLASKHGESL